MFNSKNFLPALCGVAVLSVLTACGGSSSDTDTDVDTGSGDSACATELHDAFSYFSGDMDIVLSADGCTVTLESDGKPDHTSSYWDETNPLYVAPEDPDWTGVPGNIDGLTDGLTLTVTAGAGKATTSSSTNLGPIGIAVSGSAIYNKSEGATDVTIGVINDFDRNGAHTGGQYYHYHLEPKAISDDDSVLIGVLSDGIFLYGRRCISTGDYPTDLDVSGGHTSITQSTGTSDADAEYHYHIVNELYLEAYYVLFGGDFQGTSNGFN